MPGSHSHPEADIDGPEASDSLHNTHNHTYEQSHAHAHSHTQTKAVVNRLARAIGHLESVKRMVQDGRDCSEVLMQLAAVRSALSNTAQLILKDHMAHCLIHISDSDSADTLEKLNKAIDQYMK